MRFLKQLIILLPFSYSAILTGQAPFDLVPNFGNRSEAWVSMPTDSNLFVAGELIDTTIYSNDNLYSFISQISYEGKIENTKIIGDSHDLEPFRLTPNDLFFASNNELFVFGSKRINNFHRPALLKINPKTGAILNSIYISYPQDSSRSLRPQIFTKRDSFLVVSTSFYDNHYFNFNVTIYNEEMESLNTFTITDSLYINIVYYLELESDSSILMIGDSRLVSDVSNFPVVKPFFMRTTIHGEILDFQRADYLEDKTITFPTAFTHTVNRDQNNNWILTCVIVVETHLCQTCHYLIPVTISLSPEFDSMIWYTKYPSLSEDLVSQPLVTSTAVSFDKSGFITSGFDGYSFIYKVDNAGDSVWLRKFIPLGWENRALWTEFVDIKSTPFNSFIIVGRVADKLLNKIRPWILHVDSSGCIIPTCDTLVSTSEDHIKKLDLFSLYPNPISNELYIHSNLENKSPFTITINTLKGEKLKQTRFNPKIGEQYVLFFDDLPSGLYILTIRNEKNIVVFSKNIVKQ